MAKELVDAQAIAAYLNCHPETVHRMARAGQIPAVQVGRARRFDQEAVTLALSRGTPHKDAPRPA